MSEQITPAKVGIIGCGNISGAYLKIQKGFRLLDVVAVADLDVERAKAKAEEHEIAKACSVQELLADDSIEYVLNLTIPKAHMDVNMAVLEAGKHVYVEKPLAIDLADGKKVLDLAASKGLRVGCAPDTFLGASHQTARKLIDDGWIGTPLAATAFMVGRGPESWHPNPEFFYKVGGGPMFDMGPYYLTALVNMLGPVARVASMARASFPTRLATSQAAFGQVIDVDVPTHVSGSMQFESGAIGTLIMSFDVVSSTLPRIEVYGSEGTLFVPDPNTFGGPVCVQRIGGEKKEMAYSHINHENSRSIGLADMVSAQRLGRSHRASGELAYHVLELMHGFHTASDQGKHLDIASRVERPAPLPVGLVPGMVELM